MLEKDLRVMAVVKRWGIVPTVKDQSIAEHSYFVAMYVNDMCAMLQLSYEVTLAAIQKSLWHDVDEVFSGDAPGPHKKFFVDKEKWKKSSEILMDRVFGTRANRTGSHMFSDSSQEKAIIDIVVKSADLLEAAVFMREEHRVYGNIEAEEHKIELLKRFYKTIEQLHVFRKDTRMIQDAVNNLFGDDFYKNSRVTFND